MTNLKPFILYAGQASLWCCVLACPWLAVSQVHAQTETEQERSAETLKNGLIEAARYHIRPASGQSRAAQLHPTSLLKWQNTVDKSVHGNIFVWTSAGRPEAIASIFQFYSPKQEFAAEFQSLAVTPLDVQRDDVTVWSPDRAGVELKPFEDSSPPSSATGPRLIQMRQLADRFTGSLVDWSGETYRLRLMPKPLFRYASTDPAVLDGALFALTYTTDPEVLVVVEARQTASGYRWMYGFGRMNVGELKVFEQDMTIWEVPRLKDPFYYKSGTYTLFKDLSKPIPVIAAP